ncbi:MAG: VOC family protein [Sulfuricaulis sp.]|nr:VOC family protein [Sulfuricaulis sp.]
MRIAHIALCCKVGELDEVAKYYQKLGFVIYKTTVLAGLRGYFMEHEKDRSCKLDIRENNSEPFSPVHHFCLLVDDTQRVYEDLKAQGVEFGDVGPPTLMPSGRTHFTLKGPYGWGVQFGEEMRMDDYVEDHVKSLMKKAGDASAGGG